ncbi:fatty acid desaturase family protein [Streptosporangium sp. G11]|uniref:fatty acid desaturase family protein n=1 Tax=Streptosporangium sp. G11 TaxID=3436926 RepID=UPI003EB78688
MTDVTETPVPGPVLLYRRSAVGRRDEWIFWGKLALLAALTAFGAWLALSAHPLAAVAGIVLLGAMFTHAVELQHQCLHHAAFRGARLHRIVGVPLGFPLLVVYSHYRIRHLQHHRALGTPGDTEFFGFDTRAPLTPAVLLRGAFDYRRIADVLGDCVRSASGRWQYAFGSIAPRMRRRIVAEHVGLGLLVLAAVALAASGHAGIVARLWLLPLLLVAVPLHFLVELPEHVLCDNDTTDVLRNTRSITGGWFSTWYTNGNNLHIEHHAAMNVPLHRLRERHPEVQRYGAFVQRGYADFFRAVLAEARRNAATPVKARRDAVPAEARRDVRLHDREAVVSAPDRTSSS